jgi:hypothetical protein
MNFSTVKSVTIPEGKVIKITQGSTVLWQEEAEEVIVNLIDTVGYTNDKRLGTSDGGFRNNTGTFATGLIHLEAEGDIYRTSGINFDADDNSNCGIWIYQSNQNYWTYMNTKYSKTPVSNVAVNIDIDASGNLIITTKSAWTDGTGGRWIRLCGIGSGANLIVTKNQEITA